MDDKNLMENILLLEKGVCDLFLHGTIESSTQNVHDTFNTAPVSYTHLDVYKRQPDNQHPVPILPW